MSSPALQLRTLYELDGAGQILATREPGATRGPLFTLIRSATSVVWAVHATLDAPLKRALATLARDEPPTVALQQPPRHAARYRRLIEAAEAAEAADRCHCFAGIAYQFPAQSMLAADLPLDPQTGWPRQIAPVENEAQLAPHFSGWIPGEIAAGRAPLMARWLNGEPVSICFSARSSPEAAEAGVETAAAFRGRGFAAEVTRAWALAIRASGRVPLYSTAWENHASRAVARKLGLIAYASDWSLLV